MDFAWSTVRWACTNDKFGQSGGWMRIANVDMKNNQLRCPPDWSTVSLTERGRLGHKPTLAPGCSSTTFSTQGVEYRQVCGKVIGYQYYQPNGFGPSKCTLITNRSDLCMLINKCGPVLIFTQPFKE